MVKPDRKLVIEAFVNDFVQWTPCVYLLEAVNNIPNILGDLAEYVEIKQWDLRTPEGISRNNELGITTFPTIAIGGDVLFESVIPSEDELLEAVKERL